MVTKGNEDKLEYTRMRPMYDKSIHRFLNSLSPESYYNDPETLFDTYFRVFHDWLTGSQLNSIRGLESFPHRDFCLGVTHVIDDLHQSFGERLVTIPNDYPYHWRLREDIPLRTPDTLKSNDVLVISMPFCYLGDTHPQMSAYLDRAQQLAIPVHVDSAWYGCTRGIDFDYSHPAITSVSFSLSKGLGLGCNRAGVRYSRERWRGPVTITNDFKYFVYSVMWISIQFMKKFGSDYFQNKYGETYLALCEELNLRPTKVIHLAMKENEQGRWVPVGVRQLLRERMDR